MTRITLNELNETMEEIPAKLMLIINAIDKGNAETHGLLRTLINEIKDGNSKQNRFSEQLVETISNNANDVATAVKTGIKEIDLQQAEKGKLKTNAFKCKERISHLWNNMLNSRRQAFWQYYRSKQISDVYKKLLEKNPPQMPRKFLPRMIENETKEETEIRTLLSVEKFKSEIHLQDLRSEKYEVRLNNVDANMITYFTANYENDICDNLIELWERDCKKEEEKSIKIFHGKEEWYLNNASSGFRNAAQSLRKEKKSQDSRNSENDWKGRNRYNQQRKKKDNGSRSCSRSNNQHNTHKPSTNKPIKNEKKEWPTPAEASKEERRKERPFFRKVRPYKQRQKERFETVEIKNYDKSDTNNNDQENEHTIIVPDTQDVPNQVEENVNNSVRDDFFLHGQGATKANQRKN